MAGWPLGSRFTTSGQTSIHYWQKWDLKFNDYDASYSEKPDEMAFEMAQAGDPNLRGVLERIISRDRNATKQVRAQMLLDQINKPVT